MLSVKPLLGLACAVVLAGCGSIDIASRNAPLDPLQQSFAEAQAAGAMSLVDTGQVSVSVRKVNVSVPQTLTVSEANSYYPAGDIVWRGDPIGDRYAQVQAIFEDGIGRGVNGLNGSVPVELDIVVKRFHSVTEKTRYTVGGVHSIRFVMALRDPATGHYLTKPKTVRADLKAFGGQQAIDAELAGQTQKVRVTAHLAQVIRAELGAAPEVAQNF